jgi:UDP-N-acetylglucosamine 2-epimerase
MIYGIELDRSEVGHVEPVLVALEKMDKKVVRIYDDEQMTGGRAFNSTIKINREDTVVCVGDRLQLMRFLVKYCPTSRICQLHAGEDTSESMDDSRWRWVITCLSSVQLAPTVAALNELDARGYMAGLCGAPSLEGFEIRRREALEKPPLDGRNYVLFAHNGYKAMQNGEWETALNVTAACAARRGWWTYVVVPNREACPAYVLNEDANKMVQSVYGLGHWEYQRIIAGALLMVGNSSAGVIEAPSLGTATVNVGSRQDGRPMASSVVSIGVDRLDTVEMECAFEEALASDFGERPYECVEHPAEVAADLIAEGCK